MLKGTDTVSGQVWKGGSQHKKGPCVCLYLRGTEAEIAWLSKQT